MNYDEAINFIKSTNKYGSVLGLTNIKKLAQLLGNPQDSCKTIHVAGTNGKGSTSNMINDVLIASGYSTGLYTSPYFEDYSEMIKVNKECIDNDSISRLTGIIKEKVDIMLDEGYSHPTEFEILTVLGFLFFQEKQIDFLVLEVGLGGTLDATNIVTNTLVSVITSISYDHMEYLGDTLEKIAFEKSGIIKENSSVVIYPQAQNIVETIANVSKEKNSKTYIANKNNIVKIDSNLSGQWFNYLKNDVFSLSYVKINYLGEHQLYNVLTSLTALEVIKEKGYNITEKSIMEGLNNSRYEGRLEILSERPLVIIDGAHNKDGIEYFAKAIEENFKNKKIILFFGMLKDKKPEESIPYLLPLCKKIYTLTPNNERAMLAEDLKKLINKNSHIETVAINDYNNIKDVINNLDKDECIAFVGSLYMIGKIRSILLKK